VLGGDNNEMLHDQLYTTIRYVLVDMHTHTSFHWPFFYYLFSVLA